MCLHSEPEGPGTAVRLSIHSLISMVFRDVRAFMYMGGVKVKERAVTEA